MTIVIAVRNVNIRIMSPIGDVEYAQRVVIKVISSVFLSKNALCFLFWVNNSSVSSFISVSWYLRYAQCMMSRSINSSLQNLLVIISPRWIVAFASFEFKGIWLSFK